MNLTDMHKIICIGSIVVGGYFLWKVLAPGMGLYGARVYPSQIPIGNTYPLGDNFKPVTVF